MGYLQEVDAWLDGRLQALDKSERAELKTEIKSRILESYRNGQRDCPNCNPKRPPEPARRSAKPRR